MPLIRKTSDATAPPQPGSESALRKGTADERWSAARALERSADVVALSAALKAERDPRVREAILTSLARIGNAASAEAVIPYVRSDDASLRTSALDSLRAMPVAVAARLPALLADSDADVRVLACELARAIPADGAAQLLCDLIERDGEPNVCAAAIDVLAEIGGPDALTALENCAGRFPDQPFLAFAIRVAAERIRTEPGDRLA